MAILHTSFAAKENDGDMENYLDPGQNEILTGVSVVLITVLITLWAWTQQKRHRKGLREPPGPRGWPVLGSIPAFGNGTAAHKLFVEWSKQYGPLMSVLVGSQKFVVVSNAEMAKEICGRLDLVFASRPPYFLGPMIAYNEVGIALSSYGPRLRLLRKICRLQLFTPTRLTRFEGVREGEVRAMVKFILSESEQGNALNMREVFGTMTGNIITEMMWNKRHSEYGTAGKNTQHFHEMIREITLVMGLSFIANFFPPGCKTLGTKLFGWEKQGKILHRKIDDFLECELKEREGKMLSVDSNGAVTDEDDFLSVLLKISKESDDMSRDSIKATLLDMLMAGTDSNAITMEWALSELIRHPSAMRKAQDELKTVIGEERMVKESDIHDLKYLQAVVKENFRLHPAGALAISHYNTSDCQVGKFHVPASTITTINIHAIHRDPIVWDRPSEFDPDRFLSSELDFRGHHFQFIPFGSGRRMCPGMELAVLAVHLGLAQLLQAFSWSLPGGQEPDTLDMSEIMAATLFKKLPLMVTASPRLATQMISQ